MENWCNKTLQKIFDFVSIFPGNTREGWCTGGEMLAVLMILLLTSPVTIPLAILTKIFHVANAIKTFVKKAL